MKGGIARSFRTDARAVAHVTGSMGVILVVATCAAWAASGAGAFSIRAMAQQQAPPIEGASIGGPDELWLSAAERGALEAFGVRARIQGKTVKRLRALDRLAEIADEAPEPLAQCLRVIVDAQLDMQPTESELDEYDAIIQRGVSAVPERGE